VYIACTDDRAGVPGINDTAVIAVADSIVLADFSIAVGTVIVKNTAQLLLHATANIGTVSCTSNNSAVFLRRVLVSGSLEVLESAQVFVVVPLTITKTLLVRDHSTKEYIPDKFLL
jgi:hypothetical protein